MNLYVSRAELLKNYADLDKIHDPSTYAITPEDYHIFYDLTAIASHKAHLHELAQEQKKSASIPTPKKSFFPVVPRQERLQLKAKIQDSHREIQQRVVAQDANIVPRTQAHNRKNTFETLEEEIAHRANVVSAQINTWRSVLPVLIRRFSHIPDPRRAKSVKHKMVVVMMFGLFSFIFRLSSRREMNRELTGAAIMTHLQKLFPEIDSIPHADTLARVLEQMNPKEIEATHIELIKSLIQQKKFKKLLIKGCLPISFDGTQKLCRDGVLHDDRWCERKVGDVEDPKNQQYIYVLEANITLQNGLTIPLLTEYLYRYNSALEDPKDKQDSEITAFERISERLKHYFPRLKIMLLMDALYATEGVMNIAYQNNWQYMIRLPKRKLKDLAKQLSENKDNRVMIHGQSHYRKRKQEFYWKNHVTYSYVSSYKIHLVACLESYDEVNKETGDIEKHFSEHVWISSTPLNIDNVHELCNLGARKIELIEDSINTEKNRGYHYSHAYSYDWNVMQGFHYLMRLAHAINALSEFTTKLKTYIRSLGCSATLKLIKDTLFSPWLSVDWYEKQRLKKPQLRFQLE